MATNCSVNSEMQIPGSRRGLGSLLVTTFVASALVVAAACGAYYALGWENGAALSVGSVDFSQSSWRHIGNVTLSGNLTLCYVLRIPCPSNPQNQAVELKSSSISNDTVAYVEIENGCNPEGCTQTTVVIVNSTLFCVTPKTNISSQPVCTSLIR